ncbi:MAG: hypothetical protein ACSHWQ_08155 [Spongiibacteraceae bacterium]
MIRLIGIVFVIWGLITQPLMASMSAPMTDSNPHSSMAADSYTMPHAMEHHGDQATGDVSKAPCHENSAELCDNCDTDCINGVCASSCGASGAAVLQKSLVNLHLLGSTLLAPFFAAPTYGLPARIFHPPKHT